MRWDSDYREYVWSSYDMKKIYDGIIEELFGKDKLTEIENIVKKKKQEMRIEYDLDVIERNIKENEKYIKRGSKQVERLEEFEKSPECKIIREVCKGNVEHLDELKDMIKRKKNRFGIKCNLKRKEELAKVKGELMYGCITDDHFVVFSNYYKKGLLEPLHYDVGGKWDLSDDMKRAKRFTEKEIKELNANKEMVTKLNEEKRTLWEVK